MKLGKRLGCIGFVVGFLGPVLFYASPPSFFTFESHYVCPWCPSIDVAFPPATTWIKLGLLFGLICGLILASIGFAVGYGASRAARADTLAS